MKSVRLFTLYTFIITALSGCLVLPLKQADSDRSLYWCPPLLNCASTEAITGLHRIEPFELAMDYQQAWPIITSSVSKLKGTAIEVQYEGYLYAKSRSEVVGFVDYVEVLYLPEGHKLSVRSSSLLGLWDVGVNAARTHALRQDLKEKGVIK